MGTDTKNSLSGLLSVIVRGIPSISTHWLLNLYNLVMEGMALLSSNFTPHFFLAPILWEPGQKFRGEGAENVSWFGSHDLLCLSLPLWLSMHMVISLGKGEQKILGQSCSHLHEVTY